MAVYFSVIAVFGDGQNKRHSVIIFLCAFALLFLFPPKALTLTEYVYNRNVALIYEVLTCVALSMILIFDKDAWKHLALLTFAVLCHVMIIYRLTIEYTLISHWFYLCYDELLILIGIAQMVISRDGFRTALTNVLVLLARWRANIVFMFEAILSFTKRIKKT